MVQLRNHLLPLCCERGADLLLLSLPPGCMGLLASTTGELAVAAELLSVAALPVLSLLFRRLLAAAER